METRLSGWGLERPRTHEDSYDDYMQDHATILMQSFGLGSQVAYIIFIVNDLWGFDSGGWGAQRWVGLS